MNVSRTCCHTCPQPGWWRDQTWAPRLQVSHVGGLWLGCRTTSFFLSRASPGPEDGGDTGAQPPAASPVPPFRDAAPIQPLPRDQSKLMKGPSGKHARWTREAGEPWRSPQGHDHAPSSGLTLRLECAPVVWFWTAESMAAIPQGVFPSPLLPSPPQGPLGASLLALRGSPLGP